MDNFIFPSKDNFKIFIEVVKETNHSIEKYLPPINADWYNIVSESIEYIQSTYLYEQNKNIHVVLSRILYKLAKKHELGDGNKRTTIIAVVLTSIINDYFVLSPEKLKYLVKRVAKTKGRINEEIIKNRIAKELEKIILPFN